MIGEYKSYCLLQRLEWNFNEFTPFMIFRPIFGFRSGSEWLVGKVESTCRKDSEDNPEPNGMD